MAEFFDIAGFEVLGTLGQGARSTIYHVRDKKLNQFALKRVIRKDTSDQRFVDQALLEHKIASQFDHPSLRKSIKVIKQRAFIKMTEVLVLMEYVNGVTLEKENVEDVAHLIPLTVGVADGLSQMHDAGYVHADIKPANIMVTREGVIKLIDFGQSCPSGTVKERIQGTPDYIAPEQVKRRHITPKTDVFNFGATLYWMITGQNIPTMLGKKGQAGERVGSRPKCPSPIELNPEIPPALSTLVMDCVQTDPKARPATMALVRDRLDIAASQLRRARGQASAS